MFTAAQAEAVFGQVEQDLERTPRRLELTHEALTQAARLFTAHAALPLRTQGALHVATCLRYGTRGFVTNDQQQARLAQAAGLSTHWLGESLRKDL